MPARVPSDGRRVRRLPQMGSEAMIAAILLFLIVVMVWLAPGPNAAALSLPTLFVVGACLAGEWIIRQVVRPPS